jgi:hypothetical protein
MKRAYFSSNIPTSAIFVLGIFVLTVDARADSNLNCDAYADAAVAQNQQNITLGCGFAGPAWSDDFAAHRNWCLAPATGMPNLTSEDQARTSALARCSNKFSKGNIGESQPNLQSGPPKPVDLLGLNPQPEPPSAGQGTMILNPAAKVGLNPQPEPP